MKLNHLNLTVTDVAETKAFLEKYFGMRGLEEGEGKENKNFSALFDDNGLVLTLMKGKEVQYPSTFHIGFAQESDARVNEINQRLKDDGFEVQPPRRSHAWTFSVRAPGGFFVEVLS